MEMTTWRCLLHQANRQIRSAVNPGWISDLFCLASSPGRILGKFRAAKKGADFCVGQFFLWHQLNIIKGIALFSTIFGNIHIVQQHINSGHLNDLKTFSVLPETIRFQGSREAAVQRLRAAIAPFLLRQVGPFEWLGFSINMGYPTWRSPTKMMLLQFAKCNSKLVWQWFGIKKRSTWKPNDPWYPCFDGKRPCFGGVKAKNRGQIGSINCKPSILGCFPIFGNTHIEKNREVSINYKVYFVFVGRFWRKKRRLKCDKAIAPELPEKVAFQIRQHGISPMAIPSTHTSWWFRNPAFTSWYGKYPHYFGGF